MLSRFVREPLLHFAVLGALIYAAYGTFGTRVEEETPKTISVAAGEITWLADFWEKRWNRPPTDEELQGLVRQLLRERILAMEATSMGLARDDVVVRRRLAQKLEYLSQDVLGGSTPSEEDLRAFLADNPKDYERPAVLTLTHIFFDPDKRDETTLEDAKAQKRELVDNNVQPESARDYGDKFLLQNYYPERTYPDLAKLFGTGFTEQLPALAVGQWHGPVLSGYGVHLVYIHHREEAQPARFEDVKERLLEDWRDAKRKELSEKYLARLIADYDISIESDNPALKQLEQAVPGS